MDNIELQFADLRHWREEILHSCRAYTGCPDGELVLLLNPATVAVVTQLARQSQRAAGAVPALYPQGGRLLVGDLHLRLELDDSVGLSRYRLSLCVSVPS